jgi:hypothetical protein
MNLLASMLKPFYSVVIQGADGELIHWTTQLTDPQKIADDFLSSKGMHAEEILLLKSGLQAEAPPVLVKQFKRGKDFYDRAATLDATVDIIKTFLDGIDDPDRIAKILSYVTGAENVTVIECERDGADPEIGWTHP